MSFIPLSTRLYRRFKLARFRKRGQFPYFGETIQFPPNSLTFLCAMMEGIYEQENLQLLQCAHRPGTCFIDVGANIGLMSVPILKQDPSARVLAVEASPLVGPYLRRTIAASSNQSRWQLIEAALGEESGKVSFYASPQDGSVYDGLKNTGRAADGREFEVEMITLDEAWKQAEKPEVSLIKIDVEGAELGVLRGGKELLAIHRPTIVLEWNLENMAAFTVEPAELWDLAHQLGYSLHHAPHLVAVSHRDHVAFMSRLNETFVMLPI